MAEVRIRKDGEGPILTHFSATKGRGLKQCATEGSVFDTKQCATEGMGVCANEGRGSAALSQRGYTVFGRVAPPGFRHTEKWTTDYDWVVGLKIQEYSPEI